MVGFLIGASLAVGGGAQPTVIVNKSAGFNTVKLSNGLVVRKTQAIVRGAKALELPHSHATVATWTEIVRGKATPFYAISLDGKSVARVTSTDYNLKLRYREFDPTQDAPVVHESLQANASTEIHIVQFVSQPLDDMRTALEDAGVKILDYFPQHAYLVQMTAEQKEAISGLPFVRGIATYHPAYRTEDPVREMIEAGTLGTKSYNLRLFDASDEAQARVAGFIEMVGGTVHGQGAGSRLMTATLDAAQLRQVLNLNDIQFVDRWSAPENDMDNMKIVQGQVAVNAVSTFGTFNGAGIKGAVMDGGLRTTHAAFATRTEVQGTVGVDSHGTATYGINFGDGANNAAGTGMLPLARGVIASYSSYLNGNPARLTLTQDLITRGAMYQSNSWGDAQTTVYTTISAQMDDILSQVDITILNSQSNTGNQTSRPQAWSKNVVSIGGLSHLNNSNPDDDNWTSASFGPAADGRWKVELANAYDNILTTTSTSDTAYTTGFNGTSAATPITAGAFGVMFEMWGKGIFGNATPQASHFLNRPKAALAKAIMINTARQWNITATNTRYRQGWGLPKLDNIYNNRDKFFFENEGVSLNTLQSRTYTLWVAPGEAAFKATLNYKDPSGTTSATQHRKNDLTLKVTAPDGTTTYWGNNGMLTSQWTTAGGTADLKNTTENVYIQNPASGKWTLEVIASDVNTDADPTTAGVNARYALAVHGVTHSIPVTSFTPSPGSLQSGNLDSLKYSDDNRMLLQEPTDQETTDAVRDLVVEATVPASTCTTLGLLGEYANALPQGAIDIQFFNWTTNSWVSGGGASGGILLNDTAIFGSAASSAYVQAGTNKVKARLRMNDNSIVSESDWLARLDLVRFHYQP